MLHKTQEQTINVQNNMVYLYNLQLLQKKTNKQTRNNCTKHYELWMLNYSNLTIDRDGYISDEIRPRHQLWNLTIKLILKVTFVHQ